MKEEEMMGEILMAKESKVKNENYIHIGGWMINELNLKGNELIIYAIIYGFSQAENQVFSGSLQYLADWTNSSKQGVQKNLKSLIEKGFIVKNDKYINGVKFCEYYATKFNRVYNKIDEGIQQSCTGYTTKLHRGIQQSCTNNIDIYNINNNIADNREENTSKEVSVCSLPNVIDIEKNKREEKMLKEQFENLWYKYPKKIGKEQAFKAFSKHRLNGIFADDMEEGLDRYLEYIRNNNIDDRYIKNGSTWFINKGWDDIYSERYIPFEGELYSDEYCEEVVNDFKEMFC